ncbi:nuclear transport factor 2 family protein [Lysobacter sp. CA196]|uniref:nuclear transport factor 2 family protein n=1 Tax=Lysobacter sp. CA196 TaxID=3455606 RepID=UPI003F8D336D
MRLKEVLFGAALTFALLGCAHVSGDSADSYAQAERYIIECSRDWAESVVTGDKSRRRIYFADDFVGTDTKGRAYDKAMITRENGPAKQIISNRLDSVKVRFFGSTATAQGSESWEKKDGSKGRYVWTDVWVRRNGQWQIVAAQDVAMPSSAGKTDQAATSLPD